MEKQKVTVEFQNALCDKLYNNVEEVIFMWFGKNCTKRLNAEMNADLIEDVNNAVYAVIKEFFDNEEKNDISV